MRRRRQASWIERWARPIIAGIATIGAFGTAYLTIVKLTGGAAACPTSACDQVLSSPYATVFGLPLTLFGCLAYTSMGILAVAPFVVSAEKNPDLHKKVDHWSWLLLFMGATAMTIFSGYLMYLLAFVIQAPCLYCIASATFALTMLVLALLGRTWEDKGQLFFTGVIVGVLVLTSTLGVYANVNGPSSVADGSGGGPGIEVTSTSGEAEVALAKHLTSRGIKMYGAWWCPHCHEQKQLFGKEAAQQLTYVECASPDDPRQQVATCQQAAIGSYPTWEINGEKSPGLKSLEELANLSGYEGPRNFIN
jgi:uncharacterized membrane protein/glutaredoxin